MIQKPPQLLYLVVFLLCTYLRMHFSVIYLLTNLHHLKNCIKMPLHHNSATYTIQQIRHECKCFFIFCKILKMSTLNSTFFHVFIVLPFCTIRSLFYCIFSLLGSAIVRLPLLPASHAPCIRCYASCFTSSLNNSPAE